MLSAKFMQFYLCFVSLQGIKKTSISGVATAMDGGSTINSISSLSSSIISPGCTMKSSGFVITQLSGSTIESSGFSMKRPTKPTAQVEKVYKK